jgi:hypothetical protein
MGRVERRPGIFGGLCGVLCRYLALIQSHSSLTLVYMLARSDNTGGEEVHEVERTRDIGKSKTFGRVYLFCGSSRLAPHSFDGWGEELQRPTLSF